MNIHLPLKDFKRLSNKVGNMEHAIKNKQFVVFDAVGKTVGFGTQYSANSYSTSTRRLKGEGNETHTFVQDYHVAERLEWKFPGGTYVWN